MVHNLGNRDISVTIYNKQPELKKENNFKQDIVEFQTLIRRLNTGAIVSPRHDFAMNAGKSTRIERKVLRERGLVIGPSDEVSGHNLGAFSVGHSVP